jgi:hypothetical protein
MQRAPRAASRAASRGVAKRSPQVTRLVAAAAPPSPSPESRAHSSTSIPSPPSTPTSTSAPSATSPLLGTLTTGASFLCLIHCTVLPALMTAAPILASAGASLPFLAGPDLGAALHSLTLYFVLPVGALSVGLQLYTGQGKAGVAGPAALGALGLVAIAGANGVLNPFLLLLDGSAAAPSLDAAGGAEAGCGCSDHAAAPAELGPLQSVLQSTALKLAGPALLLGGQWLQRRNAARAAAEEALAAAAAAAAPAKSCCSTKKKTTAA